MHVTSDTALLLGADNSTVRSASVASFVVCQPALALVCRAMCRIWQDHPTKEGRTTPKAEGGRITRADTATTSLASVVLRDPSHSVRSSPPAHLSPSVQACISARGGVWGPQGRTSITEYSLPLWLKPFGRRLPIATFAFFHRSSIAAISAPLNSGRRQA